MPYRRRAGTRVIMVSSNIAVLMGLLFVALELRQNTLGLGAETEWSIVAAYSELNGRISGNRELAEVIAKARHDPGALSAVDRIQFFAWQSEWINVLLSTHNLHRSGIVSEDEWRHQVAAYANGLQYPSYAAFFARFSAINSLPAELLDAIHAASPGVAAADAGTAPSRPTPGCGLRVAAIDQGPPLQTGAR